MAMSSEATMELIQIAMEEDEPVETESSWFDLGSAAEKEPAAAPGAVAVDGNVGQVWGFWENYDSRATDEESRIVHADMIDSKEYEGLKLALTFVIKVQFKFRSARRLAQLRRVEENNARLRLQTWYKSMYQQKALVARRQRNVEQAVLDRQYRHFRCRLIGRDPADRFLVGMKILVPRPGQQKLKVATIMRDNCNGTFLVDFTNGKKSKDLVEEPVQVKVQNMREFEETKRPDPPLGFNIGLITGDFKTVPSLLRVDKHRTRLQITCLGSAIASVPLRDLRFLAPGAKSPIVKEMQAKRLTSCLPELTKTICLVFQDGPDGYKDLDDLTFTVLPNLGLWSKVEVQDNLTRIISELQGDEAHFWDAAGNFCAVSRSLFDRFVLDKPAEVVDEEEGEEAEEWVDPGGPLRVPKRLRTNNRKRLPGVIKCYGSLSADAEEEKDTEAQAAEEEALAEAEAARESMAKAAKKRALSAAEEDEKESEAMAEEEWEDEEFKEDPYESPLSPKSEAAQLFSNMLPNEQEDYPNLYAARQRSPVEPEDQVKKAMIDTNKKIDLGKRVIMTVPAREIYELMLPPVATARLVAHESTRFDEVAKFIKGHFSMHNRVGVEVTKFIGHQGKTIDESTPVNEYLGASVQYVVSSRNAVSTSAEQFEETGRFVVVTNLSMHRLQERLDRLKHMDMQSQLEGFSLMSKKEQKALQKRRASEEKEFNKFAKWKEEFASHLEYLKMLYEKTNGDVSMEEQARQLAAAKAEIKGLKGVEKKAAQAEWLSLKNQINWANAQRAAYKKSHKHLSEDQLRMLQSIGFQWSTKPSLFVVMNGIRVALDVDWAEETMPSIKRKVEHEAATRKLGLVAEELTLVYERKGVLLEADRVPRKIMATPLIDIQRVSKRDHNEELLSSTKTLKDFKIPLGATLHVRSKMHLLFQDCPHVLLAKDPPTTPKWIEALTDAHRASLKEFVEEHLLFEGWAGCLDTMSEVFGDVNALQHEMESLAVWIPDALPESKPPAIDDEAWGCMKDAFEEADQLRLGLAEDEDRQIDVLSWFLDELKAENKVSAIMYEAAVLRFHLTSKDENPYGAEDGIDFFRWRMRRIQDLCLGVKGQLDGGAMFELLSVHNVLAERLVEDSTAADQFDEEVRLELELALSALRSSFDGEHGILINRVTNRRGPKPANKRLPPLFEVRLEKMLIGDNGVQPSLLVEAHAFKFYEYDARLGTDVLTASIRWVADSMQMMSEVESRAKKADFIGGAYANAGEERPSAAVSVGTGLDAGGNTREVWYEHEGIARVVNWKSRKGAKGQWTFTCVYASPWTIGVEDGAHGMMPDPYRFVKMGEPLLTPAGQSITRVLQVPVLSEDAMRTVTVGLVMSTCVDQADIKAGTCQLLGRIRVFLPPNKLAKVNADRKKAAKKGGAAKLTLDVNLEYKFDKMGRVTVHAMIEGAPISTFVASPRPRLATLRPGNWIMTDEEMLHETTGSPYVVCSIDYGQSHPGPLSNCAVVVQRPKGFPSNPAKAGVLESAPPVREADPMLAPHFKFGDREQAVPLSEMEMSAKQEGPKKRKRGKFKHNDLVFVLNNAYDEERLTEYGEFRKIALARSYIYNPDEFEYQEVNQKFLTEHLNEWVKHINSHAANLPKPGQTLAQCKALPLAEPSWVSTQHINAAQKWRFDEENKQAERDAAARMLATAQKEADEAAGVEIERTVVGEVSPYVLQLVKRAKIIERNERGF